jgi:hypothetical protein
MTLDRVLEILEHITYKGWFKVAGAMGDGFYFQWKFEAIDRATGEKSLQSGRKWYLSPHITKSEIVLTALKAALTVEEHEAREEFKYRGVMVGNPHINIDSLADFYRTAPEDLRGTQDV